MIPQERDNKKTVLLALLANPAALVGITAGMASLLLAYFFLGGDSGAPGSGKSRFIPRGSVDAPARRATAAAGESPRPIGGPQLLPGAGREELLSKDVAGTAAKIAGRGKARRGAELDAASLGEPEEGLASGEEGLGEAGEMEGEPLADNVAAAFGGAGRLQDSGFGSKGGGSNVAGGASMGSGSLDARAARATGVGAAGLPAAGRAAVSAAASARSLRATGLRRGAPGALNALASGAANAGNRQFAAGGSGPQTTTASAGAPGTVSPGGGTPASVIGGAAPAGSGGPATGAPGTGPMDGAGEDANPAMDGKIEAYGAMVAAFETQDPLVRGRGFVLCLIKAMNIRYRKASAEIDGMANSVQRAATYFKTTHPDPAVAKTLDDLYKNLTDQGGLRTTLRNSVTRLTKGEECFPKDLSADEMAVCFDTWTGPIIGLELNLKILDAFNTMVANEGGAAMNSLQDGGFGDKDAARGFLDGEIKSYQAHLSNARAQLTPDRWGNEKEAIDMSRGYAAQYTVAKMRLNDIESGKLPRKIQGDWENMARNANLNLEKANTAWNEIERQGTQYKKISKFVEAHRDTQLAANDLARGATLLGLRPPAPDGKQPSAQFVAVPEVPVSQCDPPPPPPPPGEKK